MDTTAAYPLRWIPIDQLYCSPSNPRHNDHAVDHVAASLRRFGWQQPIVARPSGEVIAGNTRLKAAQSLGMTEVPVHTFEGSDVEATAFAIADNKTGEIADWDDDALARLIRDLKDEDALDGLGFEDDEIDDILASLETGRDEDIVDPGPEPPPETPTSRRGDLWILGDHRLLCGDSTSADDVARVLDGERTKLLATDPPYAVKYDGTHRPVHDGKPSGKDWSHLYRETEIEDYGTFLDATLSATLPHLADHAPVYLWHAHTQQHVVAAQFEKHGLLLHQILVWVKPSSVFGHSYFRWRHEPCAFAWRQGSMPKHGDGKLDTVWELDWEGKARVVGNDHPTQKPLRIFEIPMEMHTAMRDVVLEPFSGSGSQLIAAEQLTRRCRAIEIEPAFVDVAIRRWEQTTGREAVLDGTKKTFAEIAEERGS